MTSEDDSSLSEDEMDEIVSRVVDQLGQAGIGEDADEDDEPHDIEVRSGDEVDVEVRDENDVDGDFEEGKDGEEGMDAEADRRASGIADGEDDREAEDHADGREHARHERAEADRRREEARRRKREAKRRAREAREAAAGMEDLGDRIEAAVEARLDHLGEHLEHAIVPGPADPPDPPTPGVVIGPADAREKAVYKTQLQKGGRVAVPDTEIEALGLEPGDALQVVLYPVE